MAEDCGRAPRVEALAGLAEIRLRQGALAEAERLLGGAEDCPEIALVRAEVLVAVGHPEQAAAVLSAELDASAPHELAYPSLAAGLVDAYLAGGDLSSAAAVSRGLDDLPATSQHPQVRAVTERSTDGSPQRSANQRWRCRGCGPPSRSTRGWSCRLRRPVPASSWPRWSPTSSPPWPPSKLSAP